MRRLLRADPAVRTRYRESRLVKLTARVVERGLVRYSPSGVPVLECRLAHRSTQREAGIDRIVEFEIGALVLGDQVSEFEQIGPGDDIAVEGFLAPARKTARLLLLHITRFSREPVATGSAPV